MSIYEVLVFVALAVVGGFAFYLYRQDTRPSAPGEKPPEHPKGQRMFERNPQTSTADRTGSGTPDRK